jgi:branched-chain amino acid transport system permease protein
LRPAHQGAFLAAAAAAFAALPALGPPAFVESFLYLVFFWIALATSWAILSGFSGYFSFGHGAFFGMGMYASANLAAKLGVPFLWTVPVAGAAAAALGVGVGAVVFRVRRLRGELFALLTLAVTFVLATVALNTPMDGGPGVYLSGVKLPRLYPSPASTIYLLGLAAAIAALATALLVQHARLGRALFAIADDEDVAEVMGVPTYGYKLAALGLSCFLAGAAGGIHASFVFYVTVAETFSITVPLFVVLMSVLGGARHWVGPAIGALVVTALSYAFTGGELAVIGRALIGLILILAILYMPHGVTGLLARRRVRPPRQAAAPPPPAVAAVAAPAIAAAAEGARPGAVLLACEDVQRSFRGIRALAGASLEVRGGEILGLVGPNGSGKSTLTNVVSGFYGPDAGRILFAGADLARLPAHRIARLGVARTYQIPRPYGRLSVAENVALAAMFGRAALDSAAAMRRARESLAFVGLAARAGDLPTELNLHQRKFLELARVLASGAHLILLDEVLAGLTPPEITEAVTLVRAIRDRGASIVFIEHNMRAVRALCDRVVVLNQGRVIAAGAPDTVMRLPEVVSAYLGTPDA